MPDVRRSRTSVDGTFKMPQYRRTHLEGGTFFFTLVTHNRAGFLCSSDARPLLRRVMRECFSRWPTQVDAIVLLPNHLHTLWTLPAGDTDYSVRWAWLKKEFTKAWLAAGQAEGAITEGRSHDGRRGVWQPKFWEHTIRDQQDLQRHMDYIHYNPVKHRLVSCAADWPWSSFHRWVRQGAYPENWGCSAMAFDDIRDTVGNDP